MPQFRGLRDGCGWRNVRGLGAKRGESVTIKEWLKKRGKTYEWLIAECKAVEPSLQITKSSVSRCANGKQWPSREFIKAVSKVTRGRVDANSWVETK